MIRKANARDGKAVAELALLLWPGHDMEELTSEFAELPGKEDAVVFLKYEGDTPIGFAYCQLRHDYVEGTDSSPVGYLEGIFVRPEYRDQGCAKELLTACEAWAMDQGCAEFASDCALDNETSLRFHQHMGFTEVNRIVCFTKRL